MEPRADTTMTPALRTAGACVAAAALAILMTWPLAAGLGRLGRITTMDGLWSIWNITWVARTIVADPANLYDANIFYPHRRALAFSEANIGAGLAAAPAWWLTRNPFTAHNTALLFAFASTVLGMWLLARRLSGDGGGRRRRDRVRVLSVFPLPQRPHPAADGGRHPARAARAAPPRRRAVAAPGRRARPRACGAGAGLCVLRDLRRADGRLRRAVSRRQPRPVARAALLERRRDCRRHLAGPRPAVLPAVPGAAARRRLRAIARRRAAVFGDVAELSGDPGARARPRARVRAASRLEDRRSAVPGHPGARLRRRPAPRWACARARPVGERRDRETVWLYGSLGLLALWASFGPAAGLYTAMFHAIPLFTFLRAPSRFGLVVVFVLAVLSALAFRRLLSRAGRWRGLAAIGLALAAVAELNVLPFPWERAMPISRNYALLAGMPRAPLAEFPFYGERIAYPLHAQYMVFSTAHWMPLINGYSDHIPGDFREAAFVLDSFPSNDAFAALQKHRARYVGVHWDMYGPRAEEIRTRLVPFARHLRLLASDEKMTLYEIVSFP